MRAYHDYLGCTDMSEGRLYHFEEGETYFLTWNQVYGGK